MKRIAQTMHRTVSSFLLCGLLAFNAQAATVYDEAVHSDLSNDHLSPTAGRAKPDLGFYRSHALAGSRLFHYYHRLRANSECRPAVELHDHR